MESHGHSAPKAEMDIYLAKALTKEILLDELNIKRFLFHFICVDERPVGYSKIIPSYPSLDPVLKDCTKLERLYVLEEFHDKKLGAELFEFNVELSKKKGDLGMWLYTWVENLRAIRFYERFGFKIVGSYDFKISPEHSNPNHRMLLKY
jgi:GNAT superfamily N-acetyltransferase